MSGPCADWIFSYSECCRNASITTVDNVTSYDLYVFSLLNNLSVGCNNSAIFRNRPVQFACISQQYCFDNGASDIDGDSLSYQLITPLTSAGSPIIYKFPYSSTQPFLSSQPANFNSLTGDLCLTPIQADVSVFAVLVSEFRNGVLIGQVERDIQMEVNACNNFLPWLTGFDGTPILSKNLCPGINYDLFIQSVDADTGEQTIITWNSGLPAAQFTTSGGFRDSLFINWTPAVSDVSSTPYCFTATVSDSHCPYTASRTFSYCFTVLDSSNVSCQLNSVSEESTLSEVHVFREENTNRFRLEWNDRTTFTKARVFDSAGKQIRDIEVSGKQEALLNFENLKSGIYHVCLDGKCHWCESLLRE